MPRKLAPDLWLFGVAVVLLSLGVVMVYSASAIVAGDRFHDAYFFLKKQLFWALLGAAGLWLALRVDYRRLARFVVPLLAVAVARLVLDHPVVARVRQRRRAGPGHRRLEAETVLPARGAHRLYLCDRRRGAGVRRRRGGRRAVQRVRLARAADRAPRPRPLRRVSRAGDHGPDRDPDAREPGRRAGPAADQGAAAAVRLVRRLGAAHHDALDRRALEHLPAGECLSATSRSTSSASEAPGCPASPRTC